ncbi:hypothetical protein ACF063_11760 [Streptomyces chartreusis]
MRSGTRSWALTCNTCHPRPLQLGLSGETAQGYADEWTIAFAR